MLEKELFLQTLKKINPTCLYQNFSFYRKLVKATLTSERLRWLKFVDKNLKPQLKQFWKYAASFSERNSTSIQLETDGKHLIEPCDVADEFSKTFQSVCSDTCPVLSPPFRHPLNFYL
jgi:hypothetical protein